MLKSQYGLEWVGFIWDCEKGVLKIPEKRILKVHRTIEEIFDRLFGVSARMFAKLTGLLISLTPSVGNISRLMTRSLYLAINQRSNWDKPINISLNVDILEELYYNKIGNICHLALLFDKRFLCVMNEKSLAKKIKCLGVTITNDLKWNTHVSNICTKANRTLGFLRRNLAACPLDVKESAYKGLVRPILEYGSSVWDPQSILLQDELEKVQKRAARFVTGNYRYVDYETGSMTGSLKQLKWESLKKRRKDSRLIMLYKGLKGIASIPTNDLVPPYQAYQESSHPGIPNPNGWD